MSVAWVSPIHTEYALRVQEAHYLHKPIQFPDYFGHAEGGRRPGAAAAAQVGNAKFAGLQRELAPGLPVDLKPFRCVRIDFVPSEKPRAWLDPGVPEGLQTPELDGQGTVVQLADLPKYGQGPLRFLPAVEADDVGIDLAQAARAGIDREAVGRVPSISRQLMVAITGTLGGF